MLRGLRVWCVVAMALLAPVAAYAQASIAGTAKDPSGAVLPGVTVEAASPALIEKTRNAVTDGTGQYRVVDLLPGTYSVTFTLQGFSAVKREGIEVSGDGVFTINVDLRVGAVSETITVSARHAGRRRAERSSSSRAEQRYARRRCPRPETSASS